MDNRRCAVHNLQPSQTADRRQSNASYRPLSTRSTSSRTVGMNPFE